MAAAARSAKSIHMAELRSATGGDLHMSGVGVKGAKVGVRYFPPKGEHSDTLIKATGPVHLLEHVSQAHPIFPRGVGRAKGRSRVAQREAKQALYNALFGGTYSGVKPLRTPWGPRMRVNHPGVANPKKPWAKGAARAKPMITNVVRRQYGSAFARGVR